MNRRGATATLLASAVVLLAGACGSSTKASSTTSSTPSTTSTTASSASGTSSTVTVGSSTTARPPTTLGPGRSTTVPVATTAAGAAHEIVVGEADIGRTLTLARGDIVRVVLHSTYWQFDDPSNGAVVAPDGPPVYAAAVGGGCVAGQGCGTATAWFPRHRNGPVHRLGPPNGVRRGRPVQGRSTALGDHDRRVSPGRPDSRSKAL